MAPRKNDRALIQTVAEAAHLPPDAFTVEFDLGEYIINHPESQKWSREVRSAVIAAAKAHLPQGSRVSLM